MYIYPPDPQLPGTNSLIPTGIAIAVLAPLVCILDLPPLIWHIRNRNTAAASLVAWIILHNLFNFINFLIWPTDDFTNRYLGVGLCDVEVKFMTAQSVALPAASLCIIRQLANVMNTERTVLAPSKLQRRRGVVMDLIWCLGLPLVMMLFHYIVQPTRYLLYGVSGCAPTVWGSWLTILLMCMPPLLLSLANAYYAIILFIRLYRYRATFSNILASGNTTKSRFLRLFINSFILTVCLLPVEIYVLISNLPHDNEGGRFVWKEVHNAANWDLLILNTSTVLYDRWVDFACGLLVFLLYGMGRDATRMYRNWLLAFGLGRVFPALLHSGSRLGTRSGTQQSSRSKFSFKSKFNSLASNKSTLASINSPISPNKPFHSGKHNNLNTQTPHQTILSRFTVPFKRRSPAPKSDPEAGPVAMVDNSFPMGRMKQVGQARGTVKAGVWSEPGSQEALVHDRVLTEGEVLVKKEVRRGSERV